MNKGANRLPLTLLGGISAEQFLVEYWQKKPLLIKQGLPGYNCPVTPDELAGLSMEEIVESRIIQEHGTNTQWDLQNGPFDENTFENLPKTHWTLLIQQLDAWLPEINELKKQFDFIPNWRIDDVMASYAPQGGSVGPHFDHYDVFLIQAHGQRQWKTGQICDQNSPLLSGTALSILSEFEEQGSWVLEPGDILYLPPKVAHHGVALNDCITLSVGFRAPNHQQLLSHFTDYLIAHTDPHQFYEDPTLTVQNNSGEIADSVISELQGILHSYVANPESLKQWFGAYITEPKNPQILAEAEQAFDEEDIRNMIRHNTVIQCNEGSRFAYTSSKSKVTLFVDGEAFSLGVEDLKLVQTLCDMGSSAINGLIGEQPGAQIVQLTLDLMNQGSLYCSEDC